MILCGLLLRAVAISLRPPYQLDMLKGVRMIFPTRERTFEHVAGGFRCSEDMTKSGATRSDFDEAVRVLKDRIGTGKWQMYEGPSGYSFKKGNMDVPPPAGCDDSFATHIGAQTNCSATEYEISRRSKNKDMDEEIYVIFVPALKILLVEWSYPSSLEQILCTQKTNGGAWPIPSPPFADPWPANLD